MKKSQVAAQPFFFGERQTGGEDITVFEDEFYCSKKIQKFAPSAYRTIDFDMRVGKFSLRKIRRILQSVKAKSISTNKDGFKLAMFIVVTSFTAESFWFLPFLKILKKQCDCFIYPVIVGANDLKVEKIEMDSKYNSFELRAHKLNCVNLFYDDNAPTIGMARVAEFIFRVMGVDLPGEEFPSYGFEDLKRMAWHISRENFNLGCPLEGAIPKYPIVDGQPKLAI